ncbi:MAG: hypothetical protein U9N49_12160 [Campylobacterota bacterium]|nr:hypothetical protein [Campylobacterota bacterium]
MSALIVRGNIMKHFLTLIIFITTLLLSSCGGGGGGTSVEQPDLKTLYLIDAPVNGVSYSCGVREGVTESKIVDGIMQHGVAECRKGAVTFCIDNFVLGTIESYSHLQKIYLPDLLHISENVLEDERLIKLGMLLQSLDDDGNIESKIDIDSSVELGISSLDGYTVESLQSYISSLGKTPRDTQAVKEHIIKHIDAKYGQKPTLQATHLTFSIDEAVGNSVGSIVMDRGNGSFIKLSLSGEGSEYFEVLQSGEVMLKQKLHQAQTFDLVVTALNDFGEVSGALSIDVTLMGKMARIGVGQLANATIKIYKFHSDGGKEFIDQIISDAQGYFDLCMARLEDQSLYIYEVTGGETSYIDIDNDGIIDEYTTTNSGVVRLIATKAWLSNTTHLIRATALSEMLYLYGVDALSSVNLDRKLDEVAKILLGSDINGDGKINVEDIMIFDPLSNRDALNPSIAKSYESIVQEIIEAKEERFKHIFDTKVIKAFDANATGCSPTTLCAFELEATKIKYRNSIAYSLKDDRLYIYHTQQEKTLATLDIPNDNYGIYLDLDYGYIFLSNEDQEIIAVDVNKLEEPTIANVTFPTKGYILGSVDEHLLIYQNSELIVVNRRNMSSVQEIVRYNLPKFDEVMGKDAYSFTIINNQLTIDQYSLSDPNNISKTNSYQVSNIDNSAKVYMDEKHTLYILTPNQSIALYRFVNNILTLSSSLALDAEKIISINDTTLYAFGNRKIYQVDTYYLDAPRVLSSFDFYQTTTQLYFDENILYTPRYMIDIDAMMLSSPYIGIDSTRANNEEYDIDLEVIRDSSLFGAF